MPKRQPHLIVNRRQVLQRLAISGITLSGGHILYEYQPWLNYDSHSVRVGEAFASAKASACAERLRQRFRAILVCVTGSQQQRIENAIVKKATMTLTITSTNASN